ncbi:MAG: Asp-tRNA(Asn)/Glu-tRNA(Gln) amidotransferase subunit GatA [Cyclobacteriaceae bacterium]|nr:Asp-tRNA(Asn)/Glu-tRNA(Gln) amidotransferase subunit GatA [Cyclobacteriaceae bacterium]MCX7636746.1 Asp-tRNA(Asn)/Glu-tRNA(Gln) amidotransferase subunit GatA [Cyclobacteriaceae bacterium]MDW8330641.1 Asp-tRNA(Asn)/Glu-tRNA(Gln) amidotransferase subunit GatA [Cyclobacteriaceae bacterium]
MYAQYSLSQLQQLLSAGKLSCRQIVEYHLQRIDQGAQLNAFSRVYANEALQHADRIDHNIKKGQAGKLAGLVTGIKDNILFEDHPAQAASKILQGFVSTYSATAVQRLLNEDAIIIGHQNCDEFGMGSSSENSVYGAVRNGIDPTRTAGGSSGGSAVAVQMDMCRISLGSDTGGSVRQPAAFCGIMGLKPTYGRISRYGLIAYGSSLDCIGILGKHTEDIALVLEVIAGADAYDSTSAQHPVPAFSKLLTARKSFSWRIAYFPEVLQTESLQEEIKDCFSQTLERFRQHGIKVEPVSFPLFDYILPTYYLLASAEAASNLARYDGIRYGYHTTTADNLERYYKKNRTEGFGEEVKRRIMLGTFSLTSDYFDAFYTQAQKVRRLIRDETQKILNDFDFILTPTTPGTAFRLGKKPTDPVQNYLADIFSVQANLAGLPAISVSCGMDRNGLPIGLQVLGRAFDELTLLQAAQWLVGRE